MFKNATPTDRARLHRHRPSEQPLLPSLAGSFAKRSISGPTRWTKLLVGVVSVYWVWTLSRGGVPREVARTVNLAVRGDSCEAGGLVSPTTPDDDQHRVVVRVRPTADGEPPLRNPDNTILSTSFHPTLSTQHHPLFDGVASSLPLALSHPKQCITPSVHSLPILPKSSPSSSAVELKSHGGAHSPELFFSVCTTPERAVKYSSVWRHFMAAPQVERAPSSSSSSRRKATAPRAPGCLVTDAQGQGDGKGLQLANAEFRRQGLSCTMRDSSRGGERYEMRVLGLIRDAWVESERRRWQDGAPLVEWYVFGDDDTWFSDSAMLREMLAGYDWREDFFLGAHSETVGNFQTFGKIGTSSFPSCSPRPQVRAKADAVPFTQVSAAPASFCRARSSARCSPTSTSAPLGSLTCSAVTASLYVTLSLRLVLPLEVASLSQLTFSTRSRTVQPGFAASRSSSSSRRFLRCDRWTFGATLRVT